MKTQVFFLLICCGYWSPVESFVDTSGIILNSTLNYEKMMTEDPIRPDIHLYEQFLRNVTNTVVRRGLPVMYKMLENVNISSPCMSSLLKYIVALKQIKVWAMKMFDASAKVPSGVLAGTLTEFGAFDQCLNIVVKDRKGEEDFRGKYCSVEAVPRLGPRPHNIELSTRQQSAFNDSIMKTLHSTLLAFYQLTIRFGMCIPSTCSNEDMQALGSQVVKPLNFSLRVSKCHVKENIRVEPIHVITIFIIVLLLILLCAGSYLDWNLSQRNYIDKKCITLSLPQRGLLAFSVQANAQKLFSADSKTGEMKCLHGIRALSMTWVILGHTYIWVIFQGLSQSIKARHWLTHIEFEAILNGWLSVSSFIFLSGLLTSHSALKYMGTTGGRLNVFLYILRRFLRLYPSLLLILGAIFFLPWISSGPFWPDLPGVEVEQCRHYWWTNLLFINNWTPVNQMCMQHSWYISADMQLHIIALVVLIPIYRSAYFGMSIATGLTVGSCLAIGTITYVNGYDPTILISTANLERMRRIVEDIHVKTFTYFGPYCIGVLTAYLLLNRPKVKMGFAFKLVGWSIATILGLSSVYGTHLWNSGNLPPPEITAAFAALHRTTFTFALAWMCYMCITGNCAFIASILKFRPFIFMSRLTFMTYLVQGPVIWTRYGSLKERMYYSHYNMLYEYFGNVILSLAIAFGCHILVEAPFSNLERLLLLQFVKVPEEKKCNNLSQVKTNSEDISSSVTIGIKEKLQNT